MSHEYLNDEADAIDSFQGRLGKDQTWAGWLALQLVGVLRRFQRRRDTPALRGVWAPVTTECFQQDLKVVEGSIPGELNGLYIRTGPNPQFTPKGGYHLFTGEGMVHAVMLRDGRALSYNNHWVRGTTFLYERLRGKELWVRGGDIVGILGILIAKIWARLRWVLPGSPLTTGATGNTALVSHAGRLFALLESNYPFLLRVCQGVIQSLGYFTFDGKLTHSFTAHPKIDPETGELLFFSYNLRPGKGEPACIFNSVSPKGELGTDVAIDVSRPQMMHDFAITKNYIIFIDSALVFDGSAMVKKRSMPFSLDKTKPSRIGLLSRSDTSAPLRWFDVPPFVFFHTANAWEADGQVHLVVCRFESFDLAGGIRGDALVDMPAVVRFDINLAADAVAMTQLQPQHTAGIDFPVVAPQVVGRPHRYAFGSLLANNDSCPFPGLVKIDVTAAAGCGIVATLMHPPGICGGEAYYVPRDGAALAAREADEDDGFLIGYTTEVESGSSFCEIWDAKTMAEKPLARIALPQRVPAGFHGLFVPSKEHWAGRSG